MRPPQEKISESLPPLTPTPRSFVECEIKSSAEEVIFAGLPAVQDLVTVTLVNANHFQEKGESIRSDIKHFLSLLLAWLLGFKRKKRKSLVFYVVHPSLRKILLCEIF